MQDHDEKKNITGKEITCFSFCLGYTLLMTRIDKILQRRLVKYHCFDRKPKNKQLFSCLKILLKKYKHVFLDEEMNTLHIFDIQNKSLFQIKKTYGSFGWNLKWISTNNKIIWLNNYYKTFQLVLKRLKSLENNL
jgi:hypothetical protein